MSLYSLLKKQNELDPKSKEQFRESYKEGAKFFSRFNDTRLRLAFDFFSEDMKKALYEIILFLHINDARFEKHQYSATKIEGSGDKKKVVQETEYANLYTPGSPYGVVGIENLNAVFREDFNNFIAEELNYTQINPATSESPIYSIASLGSIGTVGHKQTASDLDLQIQYELSPFTFEEEDLTDTILLGFAKKLISAFARRAGLRKRLKAADLAKPEVKKQIMTLGRREFAKRFPKLFPILVTRQDSTFVKKLIDKAFAQALAKEFFTMVKLYQTFACAKERKQKEVLLQEKINNIQTYIQQKYPEAEVYLFFYSIDDYRAGKHGSTLQSKEASGSAYEKILTYETLLPGIQFSPMVPSHFLLSPEVNSSEEENGKIVDFIRFHFTDIFDYLRPRIVDLGSTPTISFETMIAHSGAIYWESFKASSGNLPKALLNLLRIEMLFDPRFNSSIIELVKDPTKLDQYIEIVEQEERPLPPWNEDFFANFGIPADKVEKQIGRNTEDSKGGFPLTEILRCEADFPKLLFDPWWIRFKALKVGFGPANKYLDQAEQDAISEIIDLGFALHIKISEVFAKDKLTTYRDQVLNRLLIKGFPEIKRKYIEHIFNGELDAVNRFEKELKRIFKASLARVNKIVDLSEGEDSTNRDEFKIWYHYYESNFEPAETQIRTDILSHLRVPRGRLQVGFDLKKKHWFFRSIQKGTEYTKAGDLDHLPAEVELFDHPSFLHGVGHCIMNEYYGIYNKGTLLENRTQVEFSASNMKLGSHSADNYAYITPDALLRLFEKINNFFPPQEYEYLDIIYKKPEIVDMFCCLNQAEFGKLSILYRDNRKIWWVEEIPHPDLEAHADRFHTKDSEFWEDTDIYISLKKFLKAKDFPLTLQSKEKIAFWVNPNSFSGGGSKPARREEQLSESFRDGFFGYAGVAIEENNTMGNLLKA